MKDRLPLQFDTSISHKKMGEWEYLAHQLADRKKWAEAANALQKAADAEPGELQHWLTIAIWRRRGGQLSQAIEALQHALHLPSNTKPLRSSKNTSIAPVQWSLTEQARLWLELANLFAQDSRWQECENACLEVLERQPDHLQITELMATACLQTEHLDAAEHLLLSLLRRAPLSPWYRMRYATLLQMQGRLGDAQQQLLRLQAMNLDTSLATEVETTISYLDQLQFQQITMLLEHDAQLRTSLGHNPNAQLQLLGFHLTEGALELLQNLLWEHFDQSPYDALENSAAAPRLH